MFNYKQAIELLNQHGQGHLLAFYDELDDARRGQLLEQIEGLDFSQIPGWITDYVKNSFPMAVPDHFDPAPAYPPQPASPDVLPRAAPVVWGS